MKLSIFTLIYAFPQDYIFQNVIKNLQNAITEKNIEGPTGTSLNLNQGFTYKSNEN
jgi:hypothetical protein